MCDPYDQIVTDYEYYGYDEDGLYVDPDVEFMEELDELEWYDYEEVW